MSIGYRIKSAREAKKMTQEELGSACGTSKQSIFKYETGIVTNIPIDRIERIADILDISPAYLMGWEEVTPAYPFPSNIMRLPASRPTVPLVGQIACGTPILAEENIDGYVELPEQIRADYALICKGESMINAGIRDGDVVYIRQQEEVENGQIAAVMVDDGEATLKRFYHDGSTVTLIAENPSVSPMVFSGEEINRLHVIGLSVAYIHLLEK